MKHEEYKSLVDRIEPDKGLEQRLTLKLQGNGAGRNGIHRNRIGHFAAGFAAMLGIGLVISLMWNDAGRSVETSMVRPSVNTAIPDKTDSEAVSIPVMKLPDHSSGVQADMIGLIVYNGDIYTQTFTSIKPETAKQLRGEKLGRSKAGINEWSEPSDYTELASTIGEMDVYSVKGYDPAFRIMSYQEADGEIYAELYEHLNGITIATGEDLIGKLNLKGRIQSVKWQEFNSWNMGKDSFHALQSDLTIQNFVTALYEAKPVADEDLAEAGLYDSDQSNQKFLYLTLEDGTEVQLRLFKEGNYVKYAFVPAFFEVESDAFSALWEEMQTVK